MCTGIVLKNELKWKSKEEGGEKKEEKKREQKKKTRRKITKLKYSFGVILWELMTSKVPWADLQPLQIPGAVGYGGKKLPVPDDWTPAGREGV